MATNNLKEHETEIANAIRAKKGTTAKINPQDFAKEILGIPTGETGVIYEEIEILSRDTWDFDSKGQHGFLFLFRMKGYGGTLYVNQNAFTLSGQSLIYVVFSSEGTDVRGYTRNAQAKQIMSSNSVEPINLAWESDSSEPLYPSIVFVPTT